MRFLNKVIFINSAHVPYAEVRLDGNVHFIGTQGVGKSTLLRAILFFYNMDKSRLGIRTQDKQKSFDEFYLPHPNSYIIYEVCRETDTFCVVAFLSRGRTAFRIVACPFDRRFFIDDDGSARYEWSAISQLIGSNVFQSRIIRGYEEMRDIIYGNKEAVEDKKLRQYSLMESAKYHNVPRTIQNIFLNQSLESRVIKDTLIDSMDFADDSIDLNFYREHVKNFRQQYDDIWKWYRRERNGKVKVRTDADRVIACYSAYECSRREIADLCGNMLYALERDTQRLPAIAQQESACATELARQRRLLREENGKFNRQRDELKAREAVIDNFLQQVKTKQQHYTAIGINIIARRVEKEDELKTTQENLHHQEAVLTNKHQSVKTKYDALRQTAETERREHEIQCQQRVNRIEQELTQTLAELTNRQAEQQESVNNACQQQIDENRENELTAIDERNDLRLRLQKAQHLNPYHDTMEELQQRMAALQEKRASLDHEAALKQQEIDRITGQVELQLKDLHSQCEKESAQVENRIQALMAHVAKLDDLLNRQHHSLIAWLGKHVNGWENTLGRVLDEEAVLYNTALNPRIAEHSNSVYGVALDVAHIDRTVRTPDEVKKQKVQLETEIQQLHERLTAVRQQLNADIAELKRKPNAKLKTLRMEKMNLEAECKQAPLRIGKAETELQELNAKLLTWREQEQATLKEQMEKTEETLSQLKAKHQSLFIHRDKELDQVRRAINKLKKEATEAASTRQAAIQDEVIKKEQQTLAHLHELDARMDAELKGLGVDTDQLANIRRQLREVDEELAYVNSHRADYYTWLNDKKEFFALEQARKDERKQVRQRIDDLQTKFRSRNERLTSEIDRLTNEQRDLHDRHTRLSEAIERTRTFLNNPSCPAQATDSPHRETTKPLADILDALRDSIGTQQRNLENFKQAVTQFKTNFSPQNTFHFRTEFNADTDYMEFAAELNDFICNQKIEEYRVRTSTQYATIIKRIAKEVSDLSQHGADIRQTIHDINRDFAENNFAGVIKEIELRAVESNDRLMQQLMNIKRFDDEHRFDIGDLNLFSAADETTRTNEQAVKLLMTLIDLMDAEPKRERITLADTFKLEFKVKENDNNTSWVEKLSNVGSDGTDVLVKAMVNIMLINVFKRKSTRKSSDFKLHCMMDEIGKLHPSNVEGILRFANVRNIYLINSSPTTYNAKAYRYTYALSKDERSNTILKTLLTIR